MRTFWILLAISAVVLGWFVSDAMGPTPGLAGAVARTEASLQRVADLVRRYAERKGEYPTTDEGLSFLVTQVDPNQYLWSERALEWEGYPADQTEHFNQEDRRLLSQHYSSRLMFWPIRGGLEERNGVPLVYENRRGAGPGTYADSPANGELDNRCCTVIASQVYLYSIPGLRAADRLASARVGMVVTWVTAGLVFVVAVFFSIRCPVPREGPPAGMRLANLLMGLLLVGTGWIKCSGMGIIACYPGMVAAVPRRTADVNRYQEMLDDFHAKGVLRDQTYRKLRQAASEEAYEQRRDRRWDL